MSEQNRDVSSNSKNWQFYVGWAASALPGLALLASAGMKLTANAGFVEQFTGHFGYPAETLFWIGLTEVAVTLLYLFPRTAYLGAILVTAYLGGAVATHVRVSEAFAPPVILGVLAWLGLYLRDRRARALMPLRQAE